MIMIVMTMMIFIIDHNPTSAVMIDFCMIGIFLITHTCWLSYTNYTEIVPVAVSVAVRGGDITLTRKLIQNTKF